LYDQDWGGDETKDFSVDGCVKNWIEGGGSPSAINIGLVSHNITTLIALLHLKANNFRASLAILW
jgi:hypothetical protein